MIRHGRVGQNHCPATQPRHTIGGPAVLLALALGMFSALPIGAQARVSQAEHPCADDAGGVSNCSANEINIASVSQVYTDATICRTGQRVRVTGIDVDYGLNTGQRYDPLLWIGQRGNDPRDPDPNLVQVGDQTIGSCYVTSAPRDDTYPELFTHLEGDANDACLDIQNPGDIAPDLNEVVLEYNNLNFDVDCQDADGDGFADIHVLVTWLQNTSLMCGNSGDQTFAPGAPSKCDHTLLSLDIPYVSGGAGLRVTKIIDSDNGGNATLDDFDVRVDGAEVVWPLPGSTTGGTVLVNSAAGTYTLSEANVAGYSEGTWSCVDGNGEPVPVTNGGAYDGADVVVGSGQGVDCTITNTDDPASLTVIKQVVNDDGGSAAAGEWTIDIVAANPSNNHFPGAETPGTTITLDAGAYSVTESGGPAGYAGTLGAGCSGTLGIGESATCIITNNDIAPRLTVIKQVVNDDGGTAVAGDFTIKVTASNPSAASFPASDYPGVTISMDAGPYSVSESGPDGYLGTFSAGCSGSLGPGDAATCTITNDDTLLAQLSVVVNVINDNGGGADPADFTVQLTAVGASDEEFPGSAAPGTTVTFDPGAYSVGISGPGGYSLDLSAGCAGSLDASDSAVCSITLDDEAPRLRVVTTVVNDQGGTLGPGDFTVEVTASNPSDNGFPGAADPGTTLTIDAGTYSVGGSAAPGYESSFSAGCAGTLDVGEFALCTITHTFVPPKDRAQLTVIVAVVTDDGGDEGPADFMVNLTAADPQPGTFPGAGGSGTMAFFEPGEYAVAVTGPAGYSVSYGPGCTGTLNAAESASCLVTLNDIAPTLTLLKAVVNDHGGTAGPDAFGISVNGTVVPSGLALGYPANTPLVLNEAGAEGYLFVRISGDAACPTQLGESISLEEGQNATCTITNDDLGEEPALLTLLKEVVNDDGGELSDTDWVLTASGPVLRAGVEGSGAVTSTAVIPGVYTLGETGPDGYTASAWNCVGGTLAGDRLALLAGEVATCTIVNDDRATGPDITLETRLRSGGEGCPLILGSKARFRIALRNEGEPASGMVLDNRWSWQLEPLQITGLDDCTPPKNHTIRCKLAGLENGAGVVLDSSYRVRGHPGEAACNRAALWLQPADSGLGAEEESQVCRDIVDRLELDTDSLPPAMIGEPYEALITVAGGAAPFQAAMDGFPGIEDLSVTGRDIRLSGCPTGIAGRPYTVTIDVAYHGEDSTAACAALSRSFDLDLRYPPDCRLAPLDSAGGMTAIPQTGAVTPDFSVLPDESVQRLAVDEDGNRYLVGYTYIEHGYATDPNGADSEHPNNYDIRVVKYDRFGARLWDKTFDSGNDDYAYAVTLGREVGSTGSRLYLGGGMEVERPDAQGVSQAWLEATVLEVDPDSGCLLGRQAYSQGKGTTSLYYDLASDGERLYATGESQRHPDRAVPQGAIASVYHHQPAQPGPANCADWQLTGEIGGGDLAAQETHLLEGLDPPGSVGGDYPTAAYSITLPAAACGAFCGVLIGGVAGDDGWVKWLQPDADPAEAFVDVLDFSDLDVMAIAVAGGQLVVAGNTPGDEMLVYGYGPAPAAGPQWSRVLGSGRLRGMAADDMGNLYLVGRSSGAGASGLAFKLGIDGRSLGSDRYGSGLGMSFQDVAVMAPGFGVIAALQELSPDDFGWLQVDFGCTEDCE